MNEPKSFPGVMVSSTYTDLTEHRKALIELIHHHKPLPVELEDQVGLRAGHGGKAA